MTFRAVLCSEAGKNHYANCRFAFTGTCTNSVSLTILCYKKTHTSCNITKPGRAVQLPVSHYLIPDVFETICDIKIVRMLQVLFVQNEGLQVHLSIRLLETAYSKLTNEHQTINQGSQLLTVIKQH